MDEIRRKVHTSFNFFVLSPGCVDGTEQLFLNRTLDISLRIHLRLFTDENQFATTCLHLEGLPILKYPESAKIFPVSQLPG